MGSKKLIQKSQWTRFMRFNEWYTTVVGGPQLTPEHIEKTVIKF